MRACSLPSVDDRREPALAAQQRTTACVNVTMLVLRLATKAPAVRAFDYSVDFAVCVACVWISGRTEKIVIVFVYLQVEHQVTGYESWMAYFHEKFVLRMIAKNLRV